MPTAQWYLDQMEQVANDAQHAHLVVLDGKNAKHHIKKDDPDLQRFHDIGHPAAVLDLLQDLKDARKELDHYRRPS